MYDIAIIGSGPTGIYTLAALLDTLGRKASATPAISITMFERSERAGIGLPYSPAASTPMMLANIASIEIPPIAQTYLDWLLARPDAELSEQGLDRRRLDERTFTPRLLLGAYFRDQLLALYERSVEAGFPIAIHANAHIVDIRPTDQRLALDTADGPFPSAFDHVVIATGHDFSAAKPHAGYFPNPWTGLIDSDIPATDVGILGTSLSAIDAAMAVAVQHGWFFRDESDRLRFNLVDTGLTITMMSRKGLLPEADYYCPIPYRPLEIMTPDALAECGRSRHPLAAAFDLFRDELTLADPDYADRIGLAACTVDTIADAYFAERLATDPFRWAEHNLEEVVRNKAACVTVPWRYAILRMHEPMETLVAGFSDDDRARFDRGLKSVFVDNYAAVPPESIRRLLALRDAGILRVTAVGDEPPSFPMFIDARGQRAMTTADLPFPTLRDGLLSLGSEHPALDNGYRLSAPTWAANRIHLAAIPYLMHDRPFVQGITASADIGRSVAQSLVDSLTQDGQAASAA